MEAWPDHADAVFEAGAIGPCKVGRCHRRVKRHCMSRSAGEILRGSARNQPVKLLGAPWRPTVNGNDGRQIVRT